MDRYINANCVYSSQSVAAYIWTSALIGFSNVDLAVAAYGWRGARDELNRAEMGHPVRGTSAGPHMPLSIGPAMQSPSTTSSSKLR